MAGHSKWKNIQHRKGRQDAKRGKMFTKISKEIFAAAKSGGADPSTNLRLRLAINKAREANMPNDNIERTLKKATGDLDGVVYEEITYEGYGPHGVAVLVEVLTDNRNRSAADIRHIFNKHGGNLGESGCVSFLFARKGVIFVPKADLNMDEEEFMLMVLEMGAEDVEEQGDSFEITSSPHDFEALRSGLAEQGFQLSSAEITMVPQTLVPLEGEQLSDILKMMDALDDNDDVQNVYANFDSNEQEIEKML